MSSPELCGKYSLIIPNGPIQLQCRLLNPSGVGTSSIDCLSHYWTTEDQLPFKANAGCQIQSWMCWSVEFNQAPVARRV